VAASTHIDASLVPYDWYKEMVLLGARYHGLPAEYVAKITPAAADSPFRRRECAESAGIESSIPRPRELRET